MHFATQQLLRHILTWTLFACPFFMDMDSLGHNYSTRRSPPLLYIKRVGDIFPPSRV